MGEQFGYPMIFAALVGRGGTRRNNNNGRSLLLIRRVKLDRGNILVGR